MADPEISVIDKSIAIAARANAVVNLRIPHEGGRVIWEFSTASHNVGFSAAFQRDGQQPELCAWAAGRCASSEGTHTGWFVAPAAGRIVFRFDNTFSRFRSKQVTLTARVEAGRDACLVPGMRVRFPFAAAKAVESTTGAPSGAVIEAKPSAEGTVEGTLVPSGDAPDGYRHIISDDCHVLLVPYDALVPVVCTFRDQGNGRLIAGGFFFFRGRFHDAEAFYEADTGDCPYVGFARAVIAWARAILAFEPEAITRATEALDAAKSIVARFWTDDGTLKAIGRAIAWRETPPVPPDQLEFAIITAEVHLLQALLMVVQESIVLIIKSGLTIRYGWRLLQRLLATAEEMEFVHPHTQGGLDFGTAVINLIVSVFPPALVRIVTALGFPSSRVDAVTRMRRCFSTPGIRSPLAGFGLIAHHIFIPSFSCVDLRRHVVLANTTLDGLRRRFPGSFLFAIVQGRTHRAGKHMRDAVASYEEAVAAKPDWDEIVHFCNYELGTAHGMLGNWPAARKCFEDLRDNNTWAPVFCTYLVAACMAESGESPEAVHAAMQSVQEVRLRRLGGAHPIPAEEVAAYRVEQFLKEPASVVFPGLEMLFLFGCFPQVESDVLAGIREHVEALECMHPVAAATCNLLVGGILAAEGRWEDAERVLTSVIDAVNAQRQVFVGARYLHLLPFALYERGQIHMRRCLPTEASTVDTTGVDASRLSPAQAVAAIHELKPGIAPEEVSAHLERAKADFALARQVSESFAFKLRVHVRVHLASREVAEIQALADGTEFQADAAIAAGGEADGDEDDAHLLTPTLSSIMSKVSTAGGALGGTRA